ncbi:Endonuclease/exonuclease/phosphatase [Melampsora americana]|nr:Endonuclease/exonuclease/phosphatase [Melampsora americana]
MPSSIKPSALRIRCVTYNLNRGNADSDFFNLLFDEDIVDPINLPDLYVFSFQELAALHLTFSSFTSSAMLQRHYAILQAFSKGLKATKASEKIKDTIDLHPPPYKLVASETYGGLGLLIYARSDTVYLSIKSVEIARASCGFLNVMNNKGAIGIRVLIEQPEDFKDSKDPKMRGAELITFVTAHLAAHDSGLLTRNQNYQTLLNRLLFSSTTSSGDPTTIYDCNHLFFMGDLNYRISLSSLDGLGKAKISRSKLHQILQDGPYASIVSEHDTLSHQHQSDNVLNGLREGPINFKPTYKYDRKSPDRFVDFSQRLPGWTDRIFFTSWNDPVTSDQDSRNTEIDSRSTQVVSYHSVQHALGSDHKPVIAVFDIPDWFPNPDERLLKFKAHYQRIAPDRWWKETLWVGSALDFILGIGLFVILVIGFGSIKLGLANIAMAIGWKFRKMLR